MKDKLWAGRFSKELDDQAALFNASLAFDSRLYREDIAGSLAHAAMLGAQRIIPAEDAAAIISGLGEILHDLESGVLSVDPAAEDIHSFVEAELIRRVGEAGRRLHTARSRNDQVALDLRLYLRKECEAVEGLLRELLFSLVGKAEAHQDAIMPGYTHLQRAQPILFAHHLLAYCMMLLRDLGRFRDAAARMNVSPLGSGALAGVTYDIDREMTAKALGFPDICANSLDGVSDRDFCLELASCCSILMMHLSRLAEELILWSSWEFKFIELDDAFATGSSMMPQKKNPDLAELVRGKTGRVYGRLMSLLTVMKGLPLAYNKDLQEDKEAIFDCLDTVKGSLAVCAPMIATLRVNRENMLAAAARGFLNATDLADYLTKKGLAFRTAYKTVGAVVAHCISQGRTLEELPLDEYNKFSGLFAADLYAEIALAACVKKRRSAGGSAPESVAAQIKTVKDALA